MRVMTSTALEAVGRRHSGEAPHVGAPLPEREAVESLLLELLPRVRNLVRYLVRGDSDVEDISQEALIALLHGLPTYRGDGQLRSWADRVVARTTFAWLRRMRGSRSPRLEEPVELVAVASADAPLDEYVHRQHLVMLLDRLPNEQRHALVLHHGLEMSVPEIAAELGIPFETVRSRLRLGRAALRALAADEEAEENTAHEPLHGGP
jgi:RNA polymerase sigma-70 factor, ECF subfamily